MKEKTNKKEKKKEKEKENQPSNLFSATAVSPRQERVNVL
jgi:hypothetical protein